MSNRDASAATCQMWTPSPRNRLRHRRRGLPGHGERDDAAALGADVAHRDAGQCVEPLAQVGGQRQDPGVRRARRPRPARSRPPRRGRGRWPRCAPTARGGVASVASSYVAGPVQRAECRSAATGCSSSSRARSTYRNPVPRGARRYLRPVADSRWQPIAPTSTGIWPTDWQASTRNSASAAGEQRADAGDVVDEPAARRHVGHRDEPHAVVHQPFEVAAATARRSSSFGTTTTSTPSRSARLQQGDHVAGVLRRRRQDPVAGPEADRRERADPGTGRAVDEGDLVGSGADERRDRRGAATWASRAAAAAS